MVLGSPKLEKHQVCYAKTCKELLSVPPLLPGDPDSPAFLRLGGSGGGAISPDVQVGENHRTAEAFLERKPWKKNTPEGTFVQSNTQAKHWLLLGGDWNHGIS